LESALLYGANYFNDPKPTITMSYVASTDGENYDLEITRRNLLSEVLTGEAKQIAKWMERNSNELLVDAKIYHNFLDLYSQGDMSYDIDSAEKLLAGENIVPKTATKRFNTISENILDMASSALANRLTVHNNKTELLPLDNNFNDGFWATPLGTVMNIYPDEKLARALYSGAGLNIDFAGFLNNSSGYGIGLNYLDGNADFGKFDTSFLGGSLGCRTNPGVDKVWVEGLASYAENSVDAYGAFNKGKSNIYRAGMKLGVDLASGSNWRLTPALGVDYTYYDYGAPVIDEDLVKMSVKDTDSLRVKAEAEAVYNTKDITRFGVKVGYSYETLCSGIEQEMGLIAHEVIPITVLSKTERSARHNGHIGLSINHAISDVVSFATEYDLRVNDLATSNNFKLNFKWLY